MMMPLTAMPIMTVVVPVPVLVMPVPMRVCCVSTAPAGFRSMRHNFRRHPVPSA